MNIKNEENAKELLIELYANELDTISACYEMMGKLLDEKHVKECMKNFSDDGIYIYGGGYIGIQFYKAIEEYTTVLAVVDKKGSLLVDIPRIPVIDVNTLKNRYNNEFIFITSIKFYKEIYEELLKYIPKDRIVFLGELWGM